MLTFISTTPRPVFVGRPFRTPSPRAQPRSSCRVPPPPAPLPKQPPSRKTRIRKKAANGARAPRACSTWARRASTAPPTRSCAAAPRLATPVRGAPAPRVLALRGSRPSVPLTPLFLTLVDVVLLLSRSSPADDAFMDHMRTLAPAASDVVLRSLETVEPGAPLVHAFVRFLTRQLATHRDFELLQTYLNVFLKVAAGVARSALAASGQLTGGPGRAGRGLPYGRATRQDPRGHAHDGCVLSRRAGGAATSARGGRSAPAGRRPFQPLPGRPLP